MVEYKKQDIDEFRRFYMEKCHYHQRNDVKGDTDRNIFPNFSNVKLNDLFRRNYKFIMKITNLEKIRKLKKYKSMHSLT